MLEGHIASAYDIALELTEGDHQAAAILVLAQSVEKLRPDMHAADLLSHGICMGIRYGLFGTGCDDHESIGNNLSGIQVMLNSGYTGGGLDVTVHKP